MVSAEDKHEVEKWMGISPAMRRPPTWQTGRWPQTEGWWVN